MLWRIIYAILFAYKFVLSVEIKQPNYRWLSSSKKEDKY
jgi:hypothetical protein